MKLVITLATLLATVSGYSASCGSIKDKATCSSTGGRCAWIQGASYPNGQCISFLGEDEGDSSSSADVQNEDSSEDR